MTQNSVSLLAKAVGVLSGAPGLALMPSARNPSVRRWQRMTGRATARRSGLLFPEIEEEDGELGRREAAPKPPPAEDSAASPALPADPLSDAPLRLRLVVEGAVPVNTIRLRTDEDAAELMRHISSADKEKVWVASLDARGRVLNLHLASIGSLNQATTDPMNMLKPALLTPGTAEVAVFHNHPSGRPEPSRDDAALTRNLYAAARLAGVGLRGHWVIGADGWARVPQEAGQEAESRPWGQERPASDTLPLIGFEQGPRPEGFDDIELSSKSDGWAKLSRRILGGAAIGANFAVYLDGQNRVNGVEAMPKPSGDAWASRLLGGCIRTNSRRVTVWRRGQPMQRLNELYGRVAKALEALNIELLNITWRTPAGQMRIEPMAKSVGPVRFVLRKAVPEETIRCA